MTVEAWRRHQGGEVVEQLQRRQQQRAVSARAGFVALVEQAFGIEFAQPVQGERWPGAVTQQPLSAGAVNGRDAQRAVHGEATAVFPLRHRPRVIARQQAAPHEEAQSSTLKFGVACLAARRDRESRHTSERLTKHGARAWKPWTHECGAS